MNIEKQLDQVLLLPEASLARIYSHHRDREFAIVTAHRADMDPDQNRENMISLKGDVRAAGYGYIPLEGIGQERTEDGKTIEVKEPSLMVIGNGTRNLRRDVIQWGRKYNQYMVIYHHPKTGTELIEVAGDKVVDRFEKFSPRVAAFFSRHRGKAFHFEGVKYGSPPRSVIEGMGRFGEMLWEYRDGDDWREKIATSS